MAEEITAGNVQTAEIALAPPLDTVAPTTIRYFKSDLWNNTDFLPQFLRRVD
jgi:hypothetical protein